MAGPASTASEPERVRILYMASNPETSERLALGREVREIVEKIRAAHHRDAVELTTYWAVRPDELQHALLNVRPHVIHFSGHMSEQHDVVLEGDAAGDELVDRRAVAELVGILRDQIRVIVLNACHSEPLARELVRHVDCAIGMQQAIGDEACIEFAASFYQAIGFGRSIDVAFRLGVSALALRGIPGADVPRLFARDGADPRQIVLVPRSYSGIRAERVSTPKRSARGIMGRSRKTPRTSLAICLRESLLGEWVVDLTDLSGVSQGRAVLLIESQGTFKGHVSGTVDGLFVAAHWKILEGGQLELGGFILMNGRLTIYATLVHFSLVRHDALYGESAAGQRMAWRRCEPRAAGWASI